MSDYKILVNSYDDYTLAVEVGRLANNLEELKMKISNVKKENGNTEITFSDGHKINIKDGDTPTIDKNGFWLIGGQSTGVKARAELSFKELSEQEKLSIKGDKGDPLRWEDLTYEQKASLKGKTGDTGQASRVLKTDYDSEGNTLITFNDQTTATINRGKKGDKGNKGDSTTISSMTKNGLITTVNFTDGKSMKIEDGKSVNVESYRILDDGNTEISFSDGKKAIVKKGQDGTVKFDDLTEEQRKSLQVDVVDDLTTGGSDKALSAEQGKVLVGEIKKLRDAAPPKVMTAVIDQSNSNPLTCITYEDDAKMMEKGSPEWDDFFQSKLVLFKDGKEVRELEDSELNNLKPEDGDVMVRFPRKGLRIKTVGEKVYVSMTDALNRSDFKYYAHSRGNSPRDAFYLGAYLGYEDSGKLRSITGKAPTGNKTIGDFRSIAQANGAGYEQLAFYQWTFLQAMYVLKYGNLDSQSALGKGNTSGNKYNKVTGETNGKGIDFGSTDYKTKVRFQWIEDFYGTKLQWCDGVKTNNGKIWIAFDKFSSTNDYHTPYEGFYVFEQNGIKRIIGDSERGFIPKSDNGSYSTYFCDDGIIRTNYDRIVTVGSSAIDEAKAGVFFFYAAYNTSYSYPSVSTRLMFL